MTDEIRGRLVPKAQPDLVAPFYVVELEGRPDGSDAEVWRSGECETRAMAEELRDDLQADAMDGTRFTVIGTSS